jgi:hypothetical protein
MSSRARAFVQSWVKENVHPATYESENHHSASRANAVTCYQLALIEGISKQEISEEFDDLVTYMARQHARYIDNEIERLVRKEA